MTEHTAYCRFEEGTQFSRKVVVGLALTAKSFHRVVQLNLH